MITIYTYHLPFKTPLKTGLGVFKERSGLVIHFFDGKHESLVEASPLPGFSEETLYQSVELLKNQVNEIQNFFSENFNLDELRQYLSSFPKNASLQFALGFMGADLLIQRNKKNPDQIFGRVPAAEIAVNKVIGLGTHEELMGSFRKGIREGFTTFKVKASWPPGDLFETLEKITAENPSISLRVDANRSWPVEKLDEIFFQLKHLPIEYIEEPCRFNRRENLYSFLKNSPIPIALDETLVNRSALDHILSDMPGTILILKPSVLGNIFDLYETITRFRSLVHDTVVTTALESGIGRTMVLTAASLLGDPNRAHGLDTGHLFEKDLYRGPVVKQGRLPASGRNRLTPEIADINKDLLHKID